jgi:hypothetical protein
VSPVTALRQEHYAPLGEHGHGRDGTVPGGRRGDHQGRLRGLRRAGLSACALAGAGCGDGQPLKAHKGSRVRELVEGGGCELLYLPPYSSPDFSPIEEAFSKVKVVLKKASARTRGALVEAIAAALLAVTPEDARGFFGHCGYPLAAQPS